MSGMEVCNRALHDRQMTLSNVDLDPDLGPDTLRHPIPTPAVHSSDIRLRQTPHSTSVQLVLVATFTGIRLDIAMVRRGAPKGLEPGSGQHRAVSEAILGDRLA